MSQEIIKSISLICDTNGSNKVIDMFIIKTDDGYQMNYATGPNGGTLVARTKTPSPVELIVAEKEWDKLIKAKVKPGEYRIQESLDSTNSYTAPTSEKQLSGRDTMMLSEIKDNSHREFLLNSNNVVVEEKFDGVFLKAIVRNGKVIGSNKKGIVVNVPENIAKVLLSTNINFEVDGELIGSYYTIFELPSLRNNPPLGTYSQRKYALLKMALDSEFTHVVKSSENTRESKLAKIKEISERNGEGVVFKFCDAPYQHGISKYVIKDKFKESATVCVLSHNESLESIVIGAKDAEGKMQALNSVSTPKGKPPVGTIVEVEYLYANPNSNALQQPVFKCVRHDQDIDDCIISQLKYKASLDHSLFFTANNSEEDSLLQKSSNRMRA